MNKVAALFEDWLALRKATGHIQSALTETTYRIDMARWAQLLAPPGSGPAWDRLGWRDLTTAGIAGGLAAMADAGLSLAARQRALAPLRGWCRWLARNAHVPVDPTASDDLTVRAPARRLPAAFTSEELARILDAVDHPHAQQRAALVWPARDRAAVALLAGAGLRVSEACQLSWAAVANLDTSQPTVTITGKGQRQRVVPLSPAATRDLRAYRHERSARQPRRDSALAITRTSRVLVRVDGRPVTASVLAGWITHWLTTANVPPRPHAHAHAFRHTAADGWLDHGATIAEVQALLGHATIATTGIYTRVRPDRLHDVVRASRYDTTTPPPPPAQGH